MGQNDRMSSTDPALYALIAVALAAGMAVPWAWDCLRAQVSRRADSRAEAERAAQRAQADRWWNQHSLSTVPHSRLFDAAADDPGAAAFRSSRP